MNKFSLPPLLKEIAQGNVTWRRIEGLDYDGLGYFLFCHLVVEHYLDGYLKVYYPNLNWEGARLTFSQKVLLLSRLDPPDRFNFIPAIKHMNSLRNKLSHNIDFKIEANDLLPITQFLAKAVKGEAEVPTEQNEILQFFTVLVCAYLGGAISGRLSEEKANK
jgi:hypothetical protein